MWVVWVFGIAGAMRVTFRRNKSGALGAWACAPGVCGGGRGGGVAGRRPVEPLQPPGVAADGRGVTHPPRCGVSGGLAVGRPGGAAGIGGAARRQTPVSTERAWARVASRTKRATLPARIKMSPR